MLKVSLSGDTRNYQWTKVSPKSEKQIFRERICNGDLFFLDFFLIDIPVVRLRQSLTDSDERPANWRGVRNLCLLKFLGLTK